MSGTRAAGAGAAAGAVAAGPAAAGPLPAGSVPASEVFEGRWRWGWLFASVWLVYLLDPLRDALAVRSPAVRVVAVGSVVVFAALYVLTWQSVRARRRSGRTLDGRYRLAVLLGALTLVVVAAATVGESSLAMLVFVATLGMFLLPVRVGAGLAVALVASAVLLPHVLPGWRPQTGAALGIGFGSLAMFGVVQMIQRNIQLAAAQREIAALAVVNERSRFARDLHDILGHSLTVLTVKAELAGRLLDVGTPEAEAKARAEVADLERLAREALADVRTAVTGYREVTLVAELASARAALDAAGIEADLPTVVQDVPAERRELFGWAVREGVTNVVRHSRARTCTITVGPDAVEVVDDGAGASGAAAPDGGPARSSGLAGLRERSAALGASVVAETVAGGGFRLRVGW